MAAGCPLECPCSEYLSHTPEALPEWKSPCLIELGEKLNQVLLVVNYNLWWADPRNSFIIQGNDWMAIYNRESSRNKVLYRLLEMISESRKVRTGRRPLGLLGQLRATCKQCIEKSECVATWKQWIALYIPFNTLLCTSRGVQCSRSIYHDKLLLLLYILFSTLLEKHIPRQDKPLPCRLQRTFDMNLGPSSGRNFSR